MNFQMDTFFSVRERSSVSKEQECSNEWLGCPTLDCANPLYKEFGGNAHLFSADYDGRWTLPDVLADSTELQYFKMFLNEESAIQDLRCWEEIEKFHSSMHPEKEEATARQIEKRFLHKNYLFDSQNPAKRELQLKVISVGGGMYGEKILLLQHLSDVLREVQMYARDRLEKKWLPEFLETPEFKKRHSVKRQTNNRRSSIKVSETNLNISKWNVSSIYKGLQDDVTYVNFMEYLTITQEPGQYDVNNVLFWIEVQRCKEMEAGGITDIILTKKMNAIINCYFLSPVLPQLQINVTKEIASGVIKSARVSVQTFKDAEAAVYKDVMKLWIQFQEFCSGYNENILPFDKLRKHCDRRRDNVLSEQQCLTVNRKPISRLQHSKHKLFYKNKITRENKKTTLQFRLSQPYSVHVE